MFLQFSISAHLQDAEQRKIVRCRSIYITDFAVKFAEFANASSCELTA